MSQGLLARQKAKEAWSASDPVHKTELVKQLADIVGAVASQDRRLDALPDLAPADALAVTTDELEPGRPARPSLVHASRVAKRQTGRAGGRGPMLHAIAHIEFNAVNLALDAAWRYPQMPDDFCHDWILVAADESRHFQMLCDELASEGYAYGDFDAHDGLWSMARRTASDLVARMALVPRVLEARGLDATPVIARKFAAIGDTRGVELLDVLLEDEIRHVQVGDYWFRAVCALNAREPETTYRELITSFKAPMPKPPMNEAARRMAGFSQSELDWLAQTNEAPD